MQLNFIFSCNLSHVSMILSPARRTVKGRGNSSSQAPASSTSACVVWLRVDRGQVLKEEIREGLLKRENCGGGAEWLSDH